MAALYNGDPLRTPARSSGGEKKAQHCYFRGVRPQNARLVRGKSDRTSRKAEASASGEAAEPKGSIARRKRKDLNSVSGHPLKPTLSVECESKVDVNTACMPVGKKP